MFSTYSNLQKYILVNIVFSLFFLFNINLTIKLNLHFEVIENLDIYIFDFLFLNIFLTTIFRYRYKLSIIIINKSHFLIFFLLSIYSISNLINNNLDLNLIFSLIRLLQFYIITLCLIYNFKNNQLKEIIILIITINLTVFFLDISFYKLNCIVNKYNGYNLINFIKYKNLIGPQYLPFTLDFFLNKNVSYCISNRDSYFAIQNLVVFQILILITLADLKKLFTKLFIFFCSILSLSINLLASILTYILLSKKFRYLPLIIGFIILIFLIRFNEFSYFKLDSSASIRIFLLYKYLVIFLNNNLLIGVGLLESTSPILHLEFYGEFLNNDFIINLNSEIYQSIVKFYQYEFNNFNLPYNIQTTHNFYLQMLIELGLILFISKIYILYKYYKKSDFQNSLLISIIWLFFNSWFPGNPETLILLILLLSNQENKKVL